MRCPMPIVLLLLASSCGEEGSRDGAGDTESADDASTAPAPAVASAAESDVAASTGGDAEEVTEPASEGEILVLTYNVAGLPQGISSSSPEDYIPLISPLLNAYDLVLAQEDFWYHEVLAGDAEHPHHSVPAVQEPGFGAMGDGLNRFSQSPLSDHERTTWVMCHGMLDCASDCLASKGFSFARHSLAKGVELDVYNLHGEAGGCPEDLQSRELGYAQLIEYVKSRSEGRPILIGGDFNLHESDPPDHILLESLRGELDLVDACQHVGCGVETIDLLLVRSTPDLSLEPLSWEMPEAFHAEDGTPLSDHEPVASRIRWVKPGG